MSQLFSDLGTLFAVTALLAAADLAMTTGWCKAKSALARRLLQRD